jgi:hypothetical protein
MVFCIECNKNFILESYDSILFFKNKPISTFTENNIKYVFCPLCNEPVEVNQE